MRKMISRNRKAPQREFSTYKQKSCAAGGGFSATEIRNVNEYVKRAKGNGFFKKHHFLWVAPFNPVSVAGSAIYLKPFSQSSDRITFVNFTIADFTRNGVTGDGLTKYANTNIVSDSIFTLTDSSLGFYLHTSNPSCLASSPSDGLTDIGVKAGSTSYQFVCRYAANSNFYFDAGNLTTRRTNASAGTTQNLYLAQANSTTSFISKNKSAFGGKAITTATGSISINVALWAINDNNVFRNFSNGQYSLFEVNRLFLADTERDVQYDLVIKLYNNMGRTL